MESSFDWRPAFCRDIENQLFMAFLKHRQEPILVDRCRMDAYQKESLAVEVLVKQICLLLGLKWEEYQAALDALKFNKTE